MIQCNRCQLLLVLVQAISRELKTRVTHPLIDNLYLQFTAFDLSFVLQMLQSSVLLFSSVHVSKLLPNETRAFLLFICLFALLNRSTIPFSTHNLDAYERMKNMKYLKHKFIISIF